MDLRYSRLAGSSVFFILFVLSQTVVLAGIVGEKRIKGDDQPVIIYAQQLEHQRTKNLLIGEGAVDIRYGDIRLRADKVELNTESGQAIAQGNVILDEGTKNRITGERMEMNINTKLGTIYQGAGFLESGYYFTGEKIERIAEDEFVMEQGNYTSCDQPMPDWRLKAERCRLHIENYAYLNHFSLYVKKVPVFYFPYGVFPIKTKRSSGFLLPSVGHSNQDGVAVKNSYFWAINDWSDTTFGVDYYTKRGIGKSLEYRYALTDQDTGQVNFYHIRDEIQAKDRWQTKLNMAQQFPYQIRGVAWVDALSDTQFDRQFADDIAQRRRQEQESFFSFTKNWDGYNLNLWGNYFKDLLQTQKTVQQRMPELQFNAVSQRLGDSPVFFEWEAAWAALQKDVNKETVLRTQRFNFHPRLSLPWKLRDGLVLTPSGGIWDTWYSNTAGGGAAATRNLYDVKLALDGPQAYRIFELKGWGRLQKIKHLIYPNITYTYIPYRDQSEFFDFSDGLDRIPHTYKLDYYIINHFLGKFQAEGEEAEIRDLLTVTLSQSFDLAEERRLVNVDTSPRRPFSDLKLDVEFKPVANVRLDCESYYDVYEHYVDRINSDVWFTPPGQKVLSLNGGWRHYKSTEQRPAGEDFVRAGANLNLGPWQLEFSTHYNLLQKERVEERQKIGYYSQCWGIILTHVSRTIEEEFKLLIDLKGLGSLGTK